MIPRDKVMILCGGRGTRLREHTESIPKALVEIGGKPILWHVVSIYAAQGFDSFVLCTGYKGEQITNWIAGSPWGPEIEVECIDTGLDTPTGGRLKRASDRAGDSPFCATYADGVADIDLAALCAEHERGGRLATVTVVRPILQFGVVDLSPEGRVESFDEKPRLDHWINGGFFRFEAGALDYIDEDSVLEQAPLERLAADGQLGAYRHEGFWDCMDTYKDAVLLNDLWEAGDPPWKVWAGEPVG